MKSNRLWGIGTAIVVIAVIALGWVLGISPKLTELSTVTASLDAVKAQNQQHQLELTALAEQYKKIDDLRDQLSVLQASIPADVGLPDFIRQLNTLAASSGVTIQAITTSDPSLYSIPATPGTTVDDTGAVVPLPPAPANLVTVNMTLSVKGTPQAIKTFTKGLQTGERLFFVGQLVIEKPEVPEEGEGPAVSKGEITGMVFVLAVPAAAPAS